MKILLMTIICLGAMVPISSHAIDWLPANQFTIVADEVTTFDDGTIISDYPEVSVAYRWYQKRVINGEGQEVVQIEGDTDVPMKLVTLPDRGSYVFGGASVCIVEGNEISRSVIGWSNDPVYAQNGEPWGITSYSPLSIPMNLRTERGS